MLQVQERVCITAQGWFTWQLVQPTLAHSVPRAVSSSGLEWNATLTIPSLLPLPIVTPTLQPPMEPKGSASKGLTGLGQWSGGPWLWLVVLSPGRRGRKVVEGGNYDDTQ